MISPEKLDAMQKQWVSLLRPYGVEPAEAYPSFDRLVAAYSEPHRHYHTLEHVAEVLRVVGRLATLVTNMPAVQLAVWFHDVVYDPKAKDNEARSADWAERELADLHLPADIIEPVSKLIRATAHFDVTDDADPDSVVLIDADLAILGASESRYRRYAADIRAEYAWVPDADYRTGRTRVLQHFLARPAIFRTPLLRAEGEAAARTNMNEEIANLLRSGSDTP